jgi:hypothetical protein
MEQLKTFAVKVLGMTDEEVQSLYEKTDDGEVLRKDATDVLAKKDAANKKDLINRLKDEHKSELTKKYDEAYSEAKKKELSRLEKEAREVFGVESDKTGLDLIKDIVAKNKTNSDIKTHPDYIKLERALQEEYIPKTKYEEVQTEYQSYKQQQERARVVGRVVEDARRIFREMKPILSEDPARAANQEAEFLARFQNYDYELTEDGNHVVLKGGKRLENENMNAVLFPDLVKAETLRLYDVQQQDKKGAPGTTTQQTTPTTKFKTKDEWYLAWNEEPDTAKRVQLFEQGRAQGFV